MKNLVFLFLTTVALLAVACEKVDQEMVAKMQNDLTNAEGLAASFEALGNKINALDSQIKITPEAMKTEGNAEFNQLMEMNGLMIQKHQATFAEYNDLMAKLKSLIAEYNSGKVRTEDAKKEYETISPTLQGLPKLLERMGERSDQMQASYAKMSATWNANLESGTAPQ